AGLTAGGYDGPAPLTPLRALTAWEPSLLVLVGVVVTAGLYLWAATRLRRRGDSWPVGRDIAFGAGGLGIVTLATTSWRGLYEQTLRDPVLHEWLHLHFVFAGCVFFWPLIGIDPVPGRLPHPMRLVLLFVSLPAHAWLGISIMTSKTVLAGDYYRQLARPW